MKLTDKLVEKFGYDKMVHFLVAMVLAMLPGITESLLISIIVFIIVIVLCLIKEYELDNYVDKKDLKSGICGAIVGFIYSILCWL